MESQLPRRYNVLGVGVSELSLSLAVELLNDWASHGKGGYVCCVSVHPVALALNDPDLATIYNRSLLTTPDGMPVVWAGRQQGRAGVGRVYGPDLMRVLCDAGRPQGLRHYLYGGAAGVADQLARALERDHPGISVVGQETPPYRELEDQELAELAERIRASGCQIVWIGLGAPKQDRLMARLAPLLPEQLLIGVGAAFDFLSGTKPQAPLWMQRSGLEWCFRLVSEPRRLTGRYLSCNSRFLWHLALQVTGLRRYPLRGFEDASSSCRHGDSAVK